MSTSSPIRSEPPPVDPALVVHASGVGKRYQRGRKSLFVRRLLRLPQPDRRETFWALRDVAFDVRAGEVFGVVGTNGSGKTTLLSIVAGTTSPTEGEIAVRGRVAPVLSLGVGIGGDMSGDEAVELNGTALGLSRNELAASRESIWAFADIGDVRLLPTRFYSSGMRARLGFAIAVHTRPDVLILDEVFAVGDQTFRARCRAKIDDLRAQGTTIVLAAHDLELMQELCARVLWLDHGRVAGLGPAAEVLAAYDGKHPGAKKA